MSGRSNKTDSEPELKRFRNKTEKDEKVPQKVASRYEGPITRIKAKTIVDTSISRYTKVFECKEREQNVLGHILLASVQKKPSSYEETMNSSDHELWSQDQKSLIVSTLDGCSRENDDTLKYKSRLDIRGFEDENVYYSKALYALISILSLIRLVLAINL